MVGRQLHPTGRRRKTILLLFQELSGNRVNRAPLQSFPLPFFKSECNPKAFSAQSPAPLGCIKDLIGLRRSHAALRGEQLRVSIADSFSRVMAIHRWIDGVGEDVLFVFNLQEFNCFGYRFGFPCSDRWREAFNSDFYDQMPNQNTAGNGGSIAANGQPWDDMPTSAEITIPANGFVVFSR